MLINRTWKTWINPNCINWDASLHKIGPIRNLDGKFVHNRQPALGGEHSGFYLRLLPGFGNCSAESILSSFHTSDCEFLLTSLKSQGVTYLGISKEGSLQNRVRGMGDGAWEWEMEEAIPLVCLGSAARSSQFSLSPVDLESYKLLPRIFLNI